MASTTIVFGLLLVLLGLAGRFLTSTGSVTALIPAFFGIPLIVLGFIARAERVRKHAMHGAVVIGVIGVIGALGSLLGSSLPFAERSTVAVSSQLGMALLMVVFVALCVRSFIAARRARTAKV